MSDDLETFGFGGKQPAPCSERAQRIADAVIDLMGANVALLRAYGSVPDYTGQWSTSDYLAADQEAWNRAADALEAAIDSKDPS